MRSGQRGGESELKRQMKKWREAEKERQLCADAADLTVLKTGVSRSGNTWTLDCCGYPGKRINPTNTEIMMMILGYTLSTNETRLGRYLECAWMRT